MIRPPTWREVPAISSHPLRVVSSLRKATMALPVPEIETEPSPATELGEETLAYYVRVLGMLEASGVPFLVGGAYALARYTGIVRHTKDFDVFVRPADFDRILEVLGADGCTVERTHPHWLGKAYCGDDFVDVIYSSGNGVAEVDDGWFAHAVADEVFGVPVKLVPPEEMLWSKSFVMERERFDGADLVHLLRARAATLDWARLLDRFADNWRVLFAHLVLFGFVYPGERDTVPSCVMRELSGRLDAELDRSDPDPTLFRGSLISREQYLPDLQQWGYRDARRRREGGAMTEGQIAEWTEAIARDGSTAT
jgi:hypothetical protein